jgi:hypothetical protein
MDAAYLKELDKFFDQGFSAVQGVRKPKNLDTTIACLDAARDIYYHFYDGQVLFALGSSATLAGSGMAFTTALYKECLENTEVSGAGFDKVLQYAILQKNYRIAFAHDAVVFDEKTSHTDQLVNQRARWINTWFKYWWLGFFLVAQGITTPSRNQLLFGTVLLRPPLFMFLILSMACLFINVLMLNWDILWWVAAFAIFVIGFMIALLQSDTDAKIYASLKGIPGFVWIQLRSLLKSRKANQRSVATKHFHASNIDEVKTGKNEN